MAEALRQSTKQLCRNLKDNPNVAENMLKVRALLLPGAARAAWAGIGSPGTAVVAAVVKSDRGDSGGSDSGHGRTGLCPTALIGGRCRGASWPALSVAGGLCWRAAAVAFLGLPRPGELWLAQPSHGVGRLGIRGRALASGVQALQAVFGTTGFYEPAARCMRTPGERAQQRRRTARSWSSSSGLGTAVAVDDAMQQWLQDGS